MARIATGTGDDGTTGLFGGDRVPKTHPRIRAYGAVDELNAHLGVAATHLEGNLQDEVRRLQHRMFHVGADLASPLDRESRRVTSDHVEQIEERIESLEAELPELEAFILPGGSPGAAQLHLARTVCRRAERLAWAAEEVSEPLRVYLNRLSDYLFLLARRANRDAGVDDVTARYDG